jgi:hypothetical protein
VTGVLLKGKIALLYLILFVLFSIAGRILLLQSPLLEKAGETSFLFVFTNVFRLFIIATNEILLLYKAQLLCMCAWFEEKGIHKYKCDPQAVNALNPSLFGRLNVVYV